MVDVNTLLSERLNKKEKSVKMVALAERSVSGDLNGFAGVFGITQLSKGETDLLEALLAKYAINDASLATDLKQLVEITSEVKAINNQAAMLHGERIKKAHALLTRYRDGAFTAWLIATYGNRQTPYNLWQYYEFWHALPSSLRPQLETMPRQVVYHLASREGQLEEKKKIVKEFSGQTKAELLNVIRKRFPLSQRDRRRTAPVEGIIRLLTQARELLEQEEQPLPLGDKRQIKELLKQIGALVDG